MLLAVLRRESVSLVQEDKSNGKLIHGGLVLLLSRFVSLSSMIIVQLWLPKIYGVCSYLLQFSIVKSKIIYFYFFGNFVYLLTRFYILLL